MTQPLSWNEIQNRAARFATEWAGESSERAESQSFWNAFFDVFGVPRRRVASFEASVKRSNNQQGFIDLLWKGMLLIEHKSLDGDLDDAGKQALSYFTGLTHADLPRYVLVCDFNQFRLRDLEAPAGKPQTHTFLLADLPANIHRFGFIAGYQDRVIRESDPINQHAVVAIGELHDALKKDNYVGEPLEVFLVRLLFCLFADHTGIFQPKSSFHDLIEYHTREDGSDVGAVLEALFTTLNQRGETRQRKLAEHFAIFPYVNGRLFERHFTPPAFDSAMRTQLLALCGLDWGLISPAIFGAMFQTVIELDASSRRRQLGAHYTSEINILKTLNPLCFDELRTELDAIQNNRNALFEFRKKLRRISFLDPACGCGNFLVIAYRTLRELELDVLRAMSKFGKRTEPLFDFLQVNVDQFYGIEIEEFPAQIAQVAMWLTDHQMNVRAGSEFGEHIERIPLTKSASIKKGNALEIDWTEFVSPTQLSFIVGNPPFLGKQNQSPEQKTKLAQACVGVPGAGVLDFVAGWYIKAAHYISDTPDGFGGIVTKGNQGRKKFTHIEFGQSAAPLEPPSLFANSMQEETLARRSVRCAFVSTNSIVQGEQVGVLWGWMLAQGVHIQFAHRTFQWSNDAPGKAAVHCVIIGFGMKAPSSEHPPRLFDYDDIQGSPHEVTVSNLNPYLVDAPTVLLPNRRDPICDVSLMNKGSQPTDGGNLLLTNDEKNQLIKIEPKAKAWIRPFMGAEEFLNNGVRWCLWLKDCPPQTLKAMPHVLERIERVRKMRLASAKLPTRAWADRSSLFTEDRQPQTEYLLVPSVSSESRIYIPIGFMQANTVASNLVLTIPNATLYEFGILSSTMHNAWVRYTCGRLKSDFRYSAGIVYNNYPWPQALSAKARTSIEAAAQAVLDARAMHQLKSTSKNAPKGAQNGSAATAPASLATLYNPSTMPANLLAAHKALDKAVDAAYLDSEKAAKHRKPELKTDAQRVAFLFELYARYTSLLA